MCPNSTALVKTLSPCGAGCRRLIVSANSPYRAIANMDDIELAKTARRLREVRAH
jgi:hypothetical protein